MSFVNEVNFSIKPAPTSVVHRKMSELSGEGREFVELVPLAEREQFLASFENFQWEPVGLTGMRGGYKPGDPVGVIEPHSTRPPTLRFCGRGLLPIFLLLEALRLLTRPTMALAPAGVQ